ncbi:threonine--tRNA ligase [Pseudoalteromonas denitrificans]|jgi:threonyl-tRNA synthetase|uniref:Threonine--tRNA ligase n=1 Tax=Pseudoalteromonas denitrificans DSM 6059 TaxID=1123010 RepID=A0A1I1UCQ6_9GAMM|nr:threonine--tRNA ligase [Pseudoalteromonas denitrificans]SFD65750.1 threonyl-tRNA synthetase [Pseudoalteromonas denitrificans DSM 6059]
MKNEHRKIGQELQLFNLADFSSGMVFWYPKGYSIYQKIESYLRDIQTQYHYQEIKSPVLASSQLWEKSGHLEKFKENMFLLENDDNELALKPMNCPFHIEMFKQLCQSYRSLPLRLSEFGLCHRNEASGALNGLLRLRSFNQDDGHVFCTKAHIQAELIDFMKMFYQVYEKFGFDKKNIDVKISLRPQKRTGSESLWDSAEAYLQQGLQVLNIPFELLPEEGAFYGPKVEFALKDSLGRQWQCGTFQLDFMLAERMGASFINESGESEYPVILHRAVLGSLERFIAIMLEHHQGRLPAWLNPNAISIIPVAQSHNIYATEVYDKLKSLGFSISINNNDDSVGYKLRSHFKQKGLYALIIGDDEIQEQNLTVREKKSNCKMRLEDFILNIMKQ